MRYGIIVNPASGALDVERKKYFLGRAARCLGSACGVHGLDTRSSEEFKACARDLAREVDVLIVAGGDGTLSDVINAVDLDSALLAYIPLGTGNAIASALYLPKVVERVAAAIRRAAETGQVRRVDLIAFEDRKAVMSSVGYDGYILRESQWYKSVGVRGLPAYLIPTLKFAINGRKFDARIEIDGRVSELRDLFSVIITKHPFYGFGIRVAPRARMGDGELHVVCIDSRFDKMVHLFLKAVFGSRVIGWHGAGARVRVVTDTPQYLQLDGNVFGDRRADFAFDILPGRLRFVC